MGSLPRCADRHYLDPHSTGTPGTTRPVSPVEVHSDRTDIDWIRLSQRLLEWKSTVSHDTSEAASDCYSFFRDFSANRRTEVIQFVLDRIRLRDRLSHLALQHVAIPLPQAMHGDADRSFVHLQLVCDFLVPRTAAETRQQRFTDDSFRRSPPRFCARARARSFDRNRLNMVSRNERKRPLSRSAAIRNSFSSNREKNSCVKSVASSGEEPRLRANA